MSSNNNLTTLLSVCVGLFIINKLVKSNNVREDFGNLQFRVKAQPVAETADGAFMNVPGNFQSSISPRFSNVNYGAAIRYKKPELQNQGVPLNPISYGTPLTEGYNNGGCRLGGGQSLQVGNNAPISTDMLPSGMSAENMPLNALGEVVNQPIIYDRYIYANQKSSNLYGADFIRGDLPIVPNNTQWFSSRFNTPMDLRSGSLAVLGGVNNETTQELLALQNMSSGRTASTGSGISYSVVGNNIVSGAGGDLQVSSFPM
jgi:hypothetical protein